MTGIKIREAVVEDLPAVLALYGQPDIDNGNVLDIESAESVFTLMRSYPSYRLFVACSGDRIVGTYSLVILDNMIHKGARSALVEAVIVSAECRGQGVGKAMMNHALDLCRSANCYKLALSSNLIRESAHDFYEHIGFKRHGLSFVVHLGE
jgi:GNAT superfamily N-acetyltransferase